MRMITVYVDIHFTDEENASLCAYETCVNEQKDLKTPNTRNGRKMMNKTFEVVDAYIGNKEIKAYENGRLGIDIIINDYNVDGACILLEALGYHQLYRSY